MVLVSMMGLFGGNITIVSKDYRIWCHCSLCAKGPIHFNISFKNAHLCEEGKEYVCLSGLNMRHGVLGQVSNSDVMQ